MSGIDLSLLPAPSIIEDLDYETLLAARKARFISLHAPEKQADIAATLTLESEPIVKLLQENTYRELVLRARYNDEARALLLAYATDSNLDHIGVTYFKVARLVVSPADLAAIPPIAAVMESDDNYRRRLILSPAGLSVAGPRNAYIFHALSADGNVRDASCISPEPGTSRVFVLSHDNNGIASSALLNRVYQALSPDDVRPLCELVEVRAAEIVTYRIEADVFVLDGPDHSLVLAAAQLAVTRYADEHYTLGVGVTRSGINARIFQPGTHRVDIVKPPADLVLSKGQAARCIGIECRIAGVVL